jgi:Fe-S-cluster containining protein
LASALGLDAEPAELLDRVHAAYVALDAALAAARGPLALPCARGCSACCHEAVFVSAPEALAAILALAEDHGPAALRAVAAEMDAFAARYADELELLDLLEPGAERDEVAVRVRFACPMLDAEGGCRVHRARELNARSFGQSWDHARDEPYGCTLVDALLRGRGAALFGAREARRRFVADVPEAQAVRVYPAWFARARGAVTALADALERRGA